jgi:hypothetical protein
VTVSYGKPGGGFRTPQLHTYPSSAGTENMCPNLAVAVKLGNETKPDLVTAASFAEFGVLILHNFQPAGFAPGVIQPNWLRTVDLNGDGRQDIIMWSAQVSELTSLFNTPQGVLVRGPISVGTLGSGNTGVFGPQYALADFNGDGGQDMLLSVNQEGPGLGNLAPIFAEVFFGNGQGPTVLALTSDVNAVWTVFSIDLDGNGIPDAGIVEKSGTGVTTVQYFHNDGVGNFKLVATP